MRFSRRRTTCRPRRAGSPPTRSRRPLSMKLTPEIYRERRERVLARLEDGVAVLRSNPEQTRSNDTEYPFRQDSDFHYLTGFDEPDSVAVLTPGHPEHRFVL